MLTVMVYYKDPHEQPDEEAQECGSVQVPVQETLCHCGLGMCHPQSTWTCLPFQKLCEPHC